jgi:hypothetical protein
MIDHWCEVKAAKQTNAKDKEMEVDGNFLKKANKEIAEGNQIAPKTEERLLSATVILGWLFYTFHLPPPSFIKQP